MHPIRVLKNIVRSRREKKREEQINREVAAYIAEIDTHVRVFGLNPETPEIVGLKAQAREIIEEDIQTGSTFRNQYLDWLSPYESVSLSLRGMSHLTIHEHWFGNILQPWTLVEFHLRDYELQDLERIRVDGQGTHLYLYGQERVLYEAGVLKPGRAADPGNRVRCATGMVEHFTGINLDWREIHKYHWIELTKNEDGTWQLTYDPDPAYT